MRVVFMGSREFAVPTLRVLAERHEVVGVVTQPDRPAGRGKRKSASEVKQVAIRLGLRVFEPVSLRAAQSIEPLASLTPDLIVVAAYGQILPQSVLDLPALGCLNVHASLLPRWRGASPVQAAILHGDPETGVSIMLMEAGLDTGPILAQRATPIAARETAGTLSTRLAQIGADLLVEVLPAYQAGGLSPVAQEESLATKAPRIKKSDGRIDLNHPAAELARQILAYEPWPGSYLQWDGRRLLIRAARAVATAQASPGQVFELDQRLAIGTGEGALVLEQVQPEGKRSMDGQSFLHGWPSFMRAQLLG